MNTSWRVKAGAASLAALLAAWLVLPTFLPPPPKPEEAEGLVVPWFIRMLPDTRIRLGLDLQGGIHMVLGIDLKRALINEADRYARDLREFLPKQEPPIAFKSVERDPDSTKITLTLSSSEHSRAFEDFIQSKFNVLRVTESSSSKGEYVLDIDAEKRGDVERQTIQQALETLRNRLDEFGVAEPSIQAQGNDRIIVQLPGMADPAKAQSVLGRTAQLEFKIVDDESMDRAGLEGLVAEAREKVGANAKVEEVNKYLRDRLPAGTQILFSEESDSTTGKVSTRPYLLKSETLLTGDMLDDARIGQADMGQPAVNLQFNPRGAEIFDRVSSENVGNQLAIILDDRVQSAPVLKTRISDGRAQITFGSLRSYGETMEEAKDLSIVLRAGALPAPVEVLQNQAVGPSLGRDSIQNGMRAMVVGALFVILFMILYYRGSGVIADIALLTNVLFTFACLAALHATLTLPGIAGMLIAVGMAVDANVLIYERIREELREGKPPKLAVEAGYDRAHVTILDSNLTTIITAIVLLEYGTGPIKGFAITLIFGLIANYFTALWYTRLTYDWILHKFQPQRLSI